MKIYRKLAGGFCWAYMKSFFIFSCFFVFLYFLWNCGVSQLPQDFLSPIFTPRKALKQGFFPTSDMMGFIAGHGYFLY